MLCKRLTFLPHATAQNPPCENEITLSVTSIVTPSKRMVMKLFLSHQGSIIDMRRLKFKEPHLDMYYSKMSIMLTPYASRTTMLRSNVTK